MNPPILLALAFPLLFITGCGRTRESAPQDTVAAASEPANRFDPATLERGDTVAGLMVDSIHRERALSDEWVGSVRFAGSVLLTGRTFRHPDGDDYPYPCFEADSVSAQRLPRWAGDERRPWFCFENPSDARARFGHAKANIESTIRIDRFTIHRNLSDAVNVAQLIEIVSQSGLVAEAACFSTSESVLARKPGTPVDGPSGLTGWLSLEGFEPALDSGDARLVDSDGRALGARWQRTAADSIRVVGFDDFLRIEMRLAATKDALKGLAIATSDAALARNSAGRLVPFRRQWTAVAHRSPCDGMPS